MKKFSTLLENRRNQFIFSAFVISLFLSIASFIFYKNEVSNIITLKEKELKIISNSFSKQLTELIKDEFNDAYFISNDKILIDLLKTKSKNLDYLLKTLKTQHDYTTISITDLNGRIISSTEYNKLNSFLLNFIKKAITNKKIYTSDIYYCNLHKKIHLDFIAPIIEKNTVLGVMIFSLDPNERIYKLIQNLPTTYSSLETYIARKDGDSVTVISPLKFKKDAILQHKYSLKDKNSAIVKAVKGYTGFTSASDYRNVKIVAYVNYVPNTNWFMVTKIDEKEIYNQIFSESIIIISVTVILIMSVFAIFSLIYTFSQKNFYKNLYLSEQQFKITLKSIGDAVITTNKDGFIKFLNPVAENLTGWKFEEALNKKLYEVFKIINEDTKKEVKSPFDLVLSQGKVVGLANHTLLISKDGREIPIADSGAPILDEENQIKGVVLVFRDQTEERRIRKKIEESEARLNALINNRSDAIWSIDKNYNLIVCNEFFRSAYLAAYNFNLEVGVNLIDILSPELKEFWKPKYDEALSGKKVTFEFDEIILGKRHYFIVYLNPIYIDNEVTGISALSVDITKLKETQFALQSSEEKYRIISDLVSDYIFSTVVHEDGTVEHDWVAGSFEEITGYTFEEYENSGGWVAHLHPDDIEKDKEDMKKLLNNQKVITEVRTITKNNSIVWVRIFAQPYWDEKQKRVTKIFGAVQNINEAKLSSIALEESENKFSVAFNSSPVALSIQDEDNIFIDVNDAFCELTGYKKEEVIGKTGAELKLWVEKEEAKKINKIFEETGLIKNHEFLFRKKTGEIRKGIISAALIYINGKRADIATALDITEIKEKEEKIKEQLEELRRWYNLMLDREDRVIELKQEVNELLTSLGKNKKYNV